MCTTNPPCHACRLVTATACDYAHPLAERNWEHGLQQRCGWSRNEALKDALKHTLKRDCLAAKGVSRPIFFFFFACAADTTQRIQFRVTCYACKRSQPRVGYRFSKTTSR
ncbi:hypothetical protein MTO96_011621 [Rhipicephalus appendiculatus]